MSLPVRTVVAAVSLALCGGAGSRAQEAVAPNEPSHVERFASPRERAARDEAAATARLERDSRDVDALADRGTARVTLGKLDGALADFRRAAELAPSQPDLHTSCGYILGRLNRPKEAGAAFERAIALDPDNFFANYHYGRLLLVAGGDPKRAAVRLERAISARPDAVEIRYDLVAVYRLLGDRVQASAQLRYLRQARPRDPRLFYAEGLLALDRGDFAAGIERLEAALRLDPRLRGARDDLALAHVRAGRWADAAPLLAELEAESPAALDPAYLHALALFNLGRTAEAETRLRLLVDRFPRAAAVRTLYGVARSANGAATDELVGIFREAASLDPNGFDASFYLGRALYAARDRAGAIGALGEAVRLRPEHVQARFFLATALEDEGKTDAAAEQYEQLARVAPDSPEGHVGLGAVLVKRGEFDGAIRALSRAVELDGRLFEAHYALGRALVRAGRAEEAVASLRRAVDLAPDRADARYQLGLALRRAGRADAAAREFETVDRLNEQFRTRTNGMGVPVSVP